MALVAIMDSALGSGVEESVLEAEGHAVRRLASPHDLMDARDADALIVQWAPIPSRPTKRTAGSASRTAAVIGAHCTISASAPPPASTTSAAERQA